LPCSASIADVMADRSLGFIKSLYAFPVRMVKACRAVVPWDVNTPLGQHEPSGAWTSMSASCPTSQMLARTWTSALLTDSFKSHPTMQWQALRPFALSVTGALRMLLRMSERVDS